MTVRMEEETMSEYYAEESFDIDGDGVADVTLDDVNGDGYADAYSYVDQAGYVDPAGAGYVEPPAADGGNFYHNDYTDTTISSNPDGSAGYIDFGDGTSYSWA